MTTKVLKMMLIVMLIVIARSHWPQRHYLGLRTSPTGAPGHQQRFLLLELAAHTPIASDQARSAAPHAYLFFSSSAVLFLFPRLLIKITINNAPLCYTFFSFYPPISSTHSPLFSSLVSPPPLSVLKIPFSFFKFSSPSPPPPHSPWPSGLSTRSLHHRSKKTNG